MRIMKIKEFTPPEAYDYFQNENNTVFGVFLQRLVMMFSFYMGYLYANTFLKPYRDNTIKFKEIYDKLYQPNRNTNN